MKPLLITLFGLLSLATAQAKLVEYDLTIADKTIAPTGKKVKALAINGSIPGPTLRFTVGDVAKITVNNGLKKQLTSIHWHGLLLPNSEDGVPYLTTPPIPPGQKHVFNFPLTHVGTYWYHSHTGLQEQQGVYGSIVVEPRIPSDKVDRDYVVVLSDWTNENPKKVMRTLMSGSEYYAVKKGNAQSIYGAYKAGALKPYFEREKSRMPAMDISDVYYDQFWANGKQKIHLDAKPGERIKLRFINAGASTYFYLTSATGDMTIVAADGPSVKPVAVPTLLMGMAETYDVIVTIPDHGAYEVRATAQDSSGHASIILGKGPQHPATSPPKANLYSMEEMVEAAMASMSEMDDAPAMSGMATMDGMSKSAPDNSAPPKARPSAPYDMLRARHKTNIDLSLPRREIVLRLTGDMERYIWSFNGKTLKEESVIQVTKGEVVRFKFINDTMMHHPLHLHGHFFRLVNKHGDYSPLKHTVDVPPMGHRVIEFEANEQNDWLFHCHLLYHMDAGMTRVISYTGQGEDHQPDLDPKMLNPAYFMVNGSLENHMTMGMAMIMKGREDYYLSWDYGFEHHKEYELDLGWRHYFNPNITSFTGFRWTNQHDAKNRAFAGLEYRFPYLIKSATTLDSEGDVRIELKKDFQLTGRLSVTPSIEYDTGSQGEWGISADYLLNQHFSLTGGYTSEHGAGAGFKFRF